MSRSSRRGPWLPEEDNALVELVRTQGPNNWVRISQQLLYRSPKQCRERFHQNLKPSLNHEPISIPEGEVIEQLVHEMGKRWAEIARRLGNRSDNAVKNWWNGSMNRRRRHPSQSYNSKHIGNRMNPIHCSKGQRSSHTTTFTEINVKKPQHLQLPCLSPNHHVGLVHGHQEGLASHAPGPDHLFQAAHGVTQSQSEDERRQYSHAIAERNGGHFPSQVEQLEPQRLPSLRLPPFNFNDCHRTAERPLVSPAGSELANSLSSRQPPSLMSDSNSTYSISPKTLISPRLSSNSHWPVPARPESYSSRDFGRSSQLMYPITYENPRYDGPVGLLLCSDVSTHNTKASSLAPQGMEHQPPIIRDHRMHVSSLVQ